MQHYRTAESLLPAIPVPGIASWSATLFSAPDPDLGLSQSRSYLVHTMHAADIDTTRTLLAAMKDSKDHAANGTRQRFAHSIKKRKGRKTLQNTPDRGGN